MSRAEAIRILTAAVVAALLSGLCNTSLAQEVSVEQQVYKLSEVQRLLRPAGGLIITSDEEMTKLETDPNMQVKAFGTRFEDLARSLAGYDGALVNVAYDFFFGGDKREFFPTSPQCIRTFKALHDVARKHGVGFGASVLSPLDLGPAYYREKGRGGQSHQFQEGIINPDGSYSVRLRVQKQWFHNKGPIKLKVNCVKTFAFSEKRIGSTAYYAVDPREIVDISDSARLSVDEGSVTKSGAGYWFADGTVYGKTDRAGGRDRVLAVIVYDVEEMDYFHPDALPYLTGMLDAHKAAGITYDSFYSDEMHIQFDWDLGTHFGLTEINTRYVTPGLAAEYAELHGKRYEDFDRYLVYFAFAQHHAFDASGEKKNAAEPEMSQHVFGPKPSDIYATWKFRRDYFRLLQDHVVDLFIKAKRYGEQIFDRKPIWTRAHATWQESPTCDHVNASWKPKNAPVSRYDYTPAYDWSSTIRENMSACCDYFRWGDFLTGNGSDMPEGGWIDRNYYGHALAASLGIVNDVPYAYSACWGAPRPVVDRVNDVVAAFGLAGWMWNVGWVQGWQHRKTPVLALYPLDLNCVEERFGSWMVQYGWCDYLTEEKFAELAKVLPDGRFKVKNRTYTTLVTLFEPMVMRKTMRMIRDIAERGGTVLWTGPPPAIYHEDGRDALSDWKSTFGIESVREPWNGLNAEGAAVSFLGDLKQVPTYKVLTHLLPDLVYPVEPASETTAVACTRIGGESLTLGTLKRTAKGGTLAFLGARPRDDQSGSLPDRPRTLFHLLRALGTYRDFGAGWAEIVSNTGGLVVCESPNGAVTVTHHYYNVQENWSGGFFRPEGEKFDESVLPPSKLSLVEAKLGPYRVSYEGERLMSFRLAGGKLAAFAGHATTGITINGREYRFTDSPCLVSFAPIPREQLADGVERAWIIQCARAGEGSGELILRLPFEVPDGARWAVDAMANGRGTPSPASYTRARGETVLRLPPEMQGPAVLLFVDK